MYTTKFCSQDSVPPVDTALMMNNFHAHTTPKSDAILQSALFWCYHGRDVTV
jgi:hypothetical protein